MPFIVCLGVVLGAGWIGISTEMAMMISFAIVAVWWIAVFAMFLKEQWQFWFLAILVGMFQGGIQALSRSYFTKIIPAEKTGEYFGLMDICGKGASFLGTIVISLVSQLTGQVNIGAGAISLFFILGMIVFKMSTAETTSM